MFKKAITSFNKHEAILVVILIAIGNLIENELSTAMVGKSILIVFGAWLYAEHVYKKSASFAGKSKLFAFAAAVAGVIATTYAKMVAWPVYHEYGLFLLQGFCVGMMAFAIFKYSPFDSSKELQATP